MVKKHSISLPCYTFCHFARALLKKETKFQRRVNSATEIVRAWECRRDSFNLGWAWSMAFFGQRREAADEEEMWESEEEEEIWESEVD